jgi:hypothetical protein
MGFIGLIGCGAARSEPPRTAASSLASSEEPPAPVEGCALGVSGARVSARDTSTGVVLEFDAIDHIDELRRRVRAAAEVHGPAAHEGLGHHGAHAQGGDHGLRLWDAPPLRASVADTARGALLRVDADDPADPGALRDLRQVMHARADRLSETRCNPNLAPPEPL